jgi:two-component system cell cycle sensor histidine kinase/response regulator CckA
MDNPEKSRQQLIDELAEARGKAGQDVFRDFVEQSFIGVYIIRGEKILYANEKMAEIFGYTREEMISSVTVSDLVAAEDRALVSENIRRRLSGEIQSLLYTFTGVRKDGTPINLEVHGAVTSYKGGPAIIGALFDISARRKMEGDLHRSQKLESLAIIAGGLAHQFNNIMTVLTGNIILAKMYAKPGSEVSDILIEAEKASLVAEDLTRQLLAFSRGGSPLFKTVSLDGIIAELAGIASNDSGIACEISLPLNLWPVEADEAQIRQAIANLVINAREAMPSGGTITIKAENIADGPSRPPLLDAGNYVRVTVSDQGTGIAKDHLEKIFDPFFTTKKQGSGLGLTNTFSIIKSHKGNISVDSEEGAGTIFTFYLPAALGKAPEENVDRRIFLPGNKRILVMDDEDLVRNVIERMLMQCGCTASLARDGEEMIRLYKESLENGTPYDAVIVDLIIAGGMGGREAVRRLLEIDPHAKAIVSSGYSDDTIMSSFKTFGFRGALAKPYSISELGKVLYDVIFGAAR